MRESISRPDPAADATAVVTALAAGVAGVFGSFGAVGFRPGFVVAPVESTLSRAMPGPVVRFAITVLGDVGQKLNLAFATVLVVLTYALLAALAVHMSRRLGSRAVSTFGTGTFVWVLTAVVTLDPVTALGAALGAGAVVGAVDLVAALEGFTGGQTEDGNRRRRVVAALGTAVGTGAVGVSAGRSRTSPRGGSGGDGAEGPWDVSEQLATAGERSFDVEGMDPSVSEGFYQVDINSVNPSIDPDRWSLSVTGAVEEPFALTYPDLMDRDHEHRFVTLRCVGESLNGHKMDTALWSGVPVASVVERANPSSDCNCVMLRAQDGYYEEFPLDALRPGMLALGMNGKLLPRGHGAPVRALVPGHWGEVNVKWITEIEFLEKEQTGYWEQRGWHGTGPVKTVAKLHGKERTDDGRMVVGGHAYAGTRGISGVEVSTDGGDSWTEAELTERLPGATGPAAEVGGGNAEYAADAWRLWKHAYDPPSGSHTVVARAREADGTLQPSEETDSFPSGPSGWVSRTFTPSNG
ncbi:MAG: molybdopterin-dependent oxidoreductase [Haloarculaceae archaeon]